MMKKLVTTWAVAVCIVLLAIVTTTAAPVPVIVDIDIKPGSEPNSINLKSKGVVSVAILGGPDFDVTTIDPTTVHFEGATPLKWAIEDVQPDGYADLVFKFKTQELNLTEGDVEGTITGQTEDGTPLGGMDSVNIVP
jgi:hypothetical protein